MPTDAPKNPVVAAPAQSGGKTAPVNAPLSSPAAGAKSVDGPPRVDAAVTVAKHGGQSGGRQSKDGLVVGSPEYRERVKADDRARKKAASQVARQLQRPAALPGLPAKLPLLANAAAPPTPPALAPLDGVAPADFVPWVGSDLDSTTKLAVKVSEKAWLHNVERKLVAARVGEANTREIVEDAKFDADAKDAVVKSGGAMVADALNAMKVSSRYKHVPQALSGILLIGLGMMKVNKRLDQLVKAANASNQPAQPGQSQAEKIHE